MIDRIEELLGSLAAEDEEEQESGLALSVTEKSVPAFPSGDEEETGDGETEKRGEAGREGAWSGARASAGPRSGPETSPSCSESDRAPSPLCSVTTGEIASERPAPIARETEKDRTETAGELWRDGPVWAVRAAEPETDGTWKVAAAERTARTVEDSLPPRGERLIWSGLEPAARGGGLGTALENAGRSGAAQAGLEQAGLEQAGLKGLYRQTVRGLRPAAPALPPEQAGRTAREREPGDIASLAVDELDRAVRRDSRRYDGGMSIF